MAAIEGGKIGPHVLENVVSQTGLPITPRTFRTFFSSLQLNEPAKYIISGIINTIAGYGIFLLMLRWANWSPEAANAVGYFVALCLAFVLNKTFVFRNSRAPTMAAARFLFAFSIAFAANSLMLQVTFGLFQVRAEIAQLFAMATYTMVFYALNKYFVFSHLKGKTLRTRAEHNNHKGTL